MKCEKIQPNLLDYSRGILPMSEAAEIRDHLKTCEDCAAVLRDETALDAILKSVPTEEPVSDVWKIVESRILVSEPGLLQRLRIMAGTRLFKATGAIAVTAALLAILTIQLRPVDPTLMNNAKPNKSLAEVSMTVNWTDDPSSDSSDAMLKYIEKM